MSGNFDQQKRTVITAFNNVVRQSALAGTVELQRLVLAVDQLLTQAGPGGALELGPLRTALRELGAPEEAIAEAFLALKSREDSLGVPVSLPAEVEALPEATRNKLLDAYAKRGKSGAAERRDAHTPRERPAPPLPKAGASKARLPKAGPAKSAGGVNRALLVALAVVVLAGVGITVFAAQTAPDQARQLSVSDPSALPCSELRANHGTAVCRMSVQAFEAESEDSLRTRVDATKRALKAEGVQRLLIQTIEDSKYRGRY